MDSFMVALGVVAPMAILMGIGVLLRKAKITDKTVMKNVDTVSFRLFMPMLAFYNIYKTDFSQLNNIGFLFYGLISAFVLFLLAMFLVPMAVGPAPAAAAYGLILFRSNFVLFATQVATSLYGEGNVGYVALLGAGIVPLFNIQATILLEKARQGTASWKKLLPAILKNPSVIGTALGIAVNLSGIRVPDILMGVVQDLARMTTPICFLSVGVSLGFRTVAKRGYLISGLFIRLILVPLVFVSVACLLGYRGQPLCALLVLFGAPSSVNNCPMAAAMGADRELTVQFVAYSTVLCLPTIFIWIMALSALGLL